MGNLIKDFWTYTYKEKQYFGICEVVMGEDIAQKRHFKKHETHIEKALKTMMIPGNDFVSHMSIQKYTSFLKDRTHRADNEETYYPFMVEFEPKVESRSVNYEKQYKEAVGEAIKLVQYSIYELGYAEEDVLIMINNSRSIYVMFNPKSYKLKPSDKLNRVYSAMFNAIDEEIGLNYADRSLYNTYGLMKTPNTYYKGGYFVKITLKQLIKLYNAPTIKSILTSHKKSLNYYIPGRIAPGMLDIYQDAVDQVKNKNNVRQNKKEQLTYISSCSAKCIEHIENYEMDKGHRNNALVSVGIYLKNQGFTKEQVLDRMLQLATSWGHDESYSDIRSKANSIFRKKYNFSCEKVKKVIFIDGLDEMCKSCPYAKKGNMNQIEVKTPIIETMWASKASTRHYIMYLTLSRKKLLNKWFSPATEGLCDRTIRDMAKYAKLNREKNKDQVYIADLAEGNKYYLPVTFIDQDKYSVLGEHLKHYLKLLIKSYKAADRYVRLRVTKERVMKDLGYTDISGVHKLVKKLADLGYLVEKKGYILALYYDSYKVVSLEKEKEKREITYTTKQVNINHHQKAIGFSMSDQIIHKNSRGERKRGSPG